jgi:hypothetical protein
MNHFEQDPKLGYYQLNNKIYYNKVESLLAAQGEESPSWHFNDLAFDSVDWSKEPDINIETLYAERARQIREKYDYVLVFFSGGADSSTVVNSFVDNGIHLDEVVIGHPESGMRDWVETWNHNPAYTASEYYYTAVPQLKQLAIKSPQTRITVNDYFQDMIDTYKSDEWIMGARDYFHPSFISRYTKKNLTHVRALCEAGKRVAFVYGIDKPKVGILGNKYCAYFIDILTNTCTWDIENYPDCSTEFFYWSPDLPLLVVKQAHLVVNWIDLPENQIYREAIKINSSYSRAQRHKTNYDRAVRQPLYPKWDMTLFQTHKSTSNISAEQDAWFFNEHKNTHIYDTWTAGIDHLLRLVPDRFLLKDDNDVVQGLKPFRSKMHLLRSIDNKV